MLDGSDYFHSPAIQCSGCLQRTDARGDSHFRHTVASAALVKAGSHRVLPLDVEAVRHSHGQDKQDCKVNAAKRLVPRLRQEHLQLPLIIGGDDLYCHQPFVAQLRILVKGWCLVTLCDVARVGHNPGYINVWCELITAG
jgi:hypothetical protein